MKKYFTLNRLGRCRVLKTIFIVLDVLLGIHIALSVSDIFSAIKHSDPSFDIRLLWYGFEVNLFIAILIAFLILHCLIKDVQEELGN